MSDGAQLVVTGQDEVIAGLDAVAAAAADLTEPHRAMLGKLIPAVRAATPVRTGALAMSWGGHPSASSASIESPLRYAPRMARVITEEVLPKSTEEIVAGYEGALAGSGKRAGFGVAR